MRLEPLYRVEFTYPEHYRAAGPDDVSVLFAEGHVSGAVGGRFRAMNRARLRSDGVLLPDMKGVLATDDGATIAFELRGFGRARDYGREVIAMVVHSTDAERYRKLNDAMCVAAGASRLETMEVVIDVCEVVWEPLQR